jgi:hypothetical protein
MTGDTTRNFIIGGAFFALLIVALAYQSIRTKGCDSESHTILVLVDFTDPLGVDTRAALKDEVWSIIERAPNFSRLVLRPIVGASASGDKREEPVIELCRVEKPDFTSPWTGPAKEVRKKWREFQDKVCGNSNGQDSMNCSDPRRGPAFFEKSFAQSRSSPIMEKIVDDTRRFLSSSERSWDLIVASDWRQYTQLLDLQTVPCSIPGRVIDLGMLPLFTRSGTRIFRASVSGRDANKIFNFFIPRIGMNNEEADCLLERVATPFFLNNMEGGGGVDAYLDKRLPRS